MGLAPELGRNRKTIMPEAYGSELILDLHHCKVDSFTREVIRAYCKSLCQVIGMQPEELHFWDDEDVPVADRQTSAQTKGTSAVQFIITSSITIHALDLLGNVYVNIFSCKDFNEEVAVLETLRWFGGHVANKTVVKRI